MEFVRCASFLSISDCIIEKYEFLTRFNDYLMVNVFANALIIYSIEFV